VPLTQAIPNCTNWPKRETAPLPTPFLVHLRVDRPILTGTDGSDPLWLCWLGIPARDPIKMLSRVHRGIFDLPQGVRREFGYFRSPTFDRRQCDEQLRGRFSIPMRWQSLVVRWHMSKAPKSLAAKVDALEARVRAIESELTFLRGVNAQPERAATREAGIAEDHRILVSLAEAAALCGRSEASIRHWCDDSKIGLRDAHGAWSVNLIELAELLRERFPSAELPARLAELVSPNVRPAKPHPG